MIRFMLETGEKYLHRDLGDNNDEDGKDGEENEIEVDKIGGRYQV